MIDYTPPAHWLRSNSTVSSPHRVVFFDAESYIDDSGVDERHTLRWWRAKCFRRHVISPRYPVETVATGTDQQYFADILDDWSTTKDTLWVYAHNLAYDLTVTNVLHQLWATGWQLTDINVGGKSPWVRLRCGRRRIILTDSFSWLPAPMDYISSCVGISRPVVVNWRDATDAQVAERCAADVDILSSAMLQIMDWWDDNSMGRWAWTGPGCGWSIFRRKHLHHKVLMSNDTERCDFERRAIYGGRRDAFRIGGLGPGYYVDLDFANAYPRLASVTPVPVREIGRCDSVPVSGYVKRPLDWGVVSECVVSTDEPMVPCRIGKDVLYPIGTFSTVLSSPDIDAAVRNGAKIHIGRTVIYRLATIMDSWGDWICDVVNDSTGRYPDIVRTMVKHQSRTVVGRWAMHRTVAEDWGVACYPWFHVENGRNLDTDTPMEVVHAFGRHLQLQHNREPQNGFPAITAFIEAACRQYLNDAMRLMGNTEVMQCDTDGFLVGWPGLETHEVKRPLSEHTFGWRSITSMAPEKCLPTSIGPLDIKIKGIYRSALIRGPQQMILDDTRIMSGVPRKLDETAPFEWQGWVWPGLEWQLTHSSPGVYTRPHMKTSITGPYGSRWILPTGMTIPATVEICDGDNTVLHPASYGHSQFTDEWMAKQPEALIRAVCR